MNKLNKSFIRKYSISLKFDILMKKDIILKHKL